LNKNQLEFAKLRLGAEKLGQILNFFKSLATLGTILCCIYLIFDSLVQMAHANPQGVNAIAEVVKNLGIGSILGYVVAAGCAGGWAMERKGKKRLLVDYANRRATREAGDAYHESSGLTESGDTPSTTEGP
jgi:hypothetical protein